MNDPLKAARPTARGRNRRLTTATANCVTIELRIIKKAVAA